MQVKLRKLLLGPNHFRLDDSVLIGIEHFDHEFYAILMEKKNPPIDEFVLNVVPTNTKLDLCSDNLRLVGFGKIGDTFHAVLEGST